jgi:hypothetical protein
VGAADLLAAPFAALRGPEPRDTVAVSLGGGPVVQQLYGDYLRSHELLKGAAVSFVILAAGSLVDFRNAYGHEGLVWIAAIAGLALSILSLHFSRRAVAQATLLAKSLHSLDGRAASLQPTSSVTPPASSE